MTVVVEADAELADQITLILEGDVSRLSELGDLEAFLAEHPHENVIVLGASVPMSQATRLADSVRTTRPATSVVLVRKRMESAMLAAAMRAGVRDVVAVRDLAPLADAVRRAESLAEAMRESMVGTGEEAAVVGTLVTVFSTKGGVGKSTVATNLAAAFTTQGRRVCVVDLDVQGGDVAIMLQLFPTRSLADIESLRGAIDEDGVLSLLTQHHSGLQVLAAPLHLEARDSVSPDQVATVLEVLKTRFEVVVVDTSPAFDDLALSAFDHSDFLVLVGTLDIPALKNLKMAAGTLDLLSMPRHKWRLVLNRADAKVGLTPAEFEKTLGLPISCAIPTSRDVLASVNRGETLVQGSPRHPVSLAIVELARSLVPDGSAPAPAATPSRFFQRFRRMSQS
jgi:pilus assembly protein CpaE